MRCAHEYADLVEGNESVFAVDTSAITFGPGAIAEVGAQARAHGMTRAALFTDSVLVSHPAVEHARASLLAAGVDVALYDAVHVEPTDASFLDAIEFARDARVDGYVSVGGGSVMDTAKAADLYTTHPADLLDYVNAPIGRALPVPGPLRPHIACPTTSGTGSECTGIVIFDLLSMQVKTGIASRQLKPTHALVDPTVTATLPAAVVAASGFDVLSHALESYTARPYTQRPAPGQPALRPMSQGANPWSDIGCQTALSLIGTYLERAVADADDAEAREQMMWAATLAGIAFGNAGVHIPHAMASSVAGLAREFRPDGYPLMGSDAGHALVPHGMSVIVNAPAAFRRTAPLNPERHLHAAALLGADTRGASPQEAGEVLAAHLEGMMQRTGIPNGLGGLGYHDGDVAALTAGAWAQQRLLVNAPLPVSEDLLAELYRAAVRYW